MIVSSHQKGWKIITQRSYGLLAAMIAYQYKMDLPVEVMVPLLVAIAEHDDALPKRWSLKTLPKPAPQEALQYLMETTATTINHGLPINLNVMRLAND